LNQVEQQFSTDTTTIVTSNQINEKLMGAVVDKNLHEERIIDE